MMETISEPKSYGIIANSAQRKLIQELENNGAKVFQFAPLEIRKIESPDKFDFTKIRLKNYDWIIFPDVYAVDYFLELLNEQGIDLFDLDAIRVLACGEAIADRLRFVQLHADIITNSEKSEIVVSELSNYIGESEIAKTSFLIPKNIDSEIDFKEILLKFKAKVTELPLYKIIKNEKSEAAKLKTLLKGGAIDEFVFASPEDVYCLKTYVAPESLTKVLSEILISATNEITIQNLSENEIRASRITNKKGS